MKNKKPFYGQEMKNLIIIMTFLSLVGIFAIIWTMWFSNADPRTNSIITVVSSVVILLSVVLIITGKWSSGTGKLKMRDKIIKEMELNGTEKILDIGCGRGLLAIGLAKKITTGSVIGADHWIGTFEYSNEKEQAIENAILESVSDKVRIEAADVTSLPYSDNEFDIVTSSLMLHHVKDWSKAMSELRRVLKPDGKLYIADIPYRSISKSLENSGLKVDKCKGIARLFFFKVYLIISIK